MAFADFDLLDQAGKILGILVSICGPAMIPDDLASPIISHLQRMGTC